MNAAMECAEAIACPARAALACKRFLVTLPASDLLVLSLHFHEQLTLEQIESLVDRPREELLVTIGRGMGVAFASLAASAA